MTYNSLLENNKNVKLKYEQLLQTDEWLEKRNKIINRDGGCCQKCKRSYTINNPPHKVAGYRHIYEDNSEDSIIRFTDPMDDLGEVHEIDLIDIFPTANFKTSDVPISLQVHHRYYILKRLPWIYDDEVLVTLCDRCNLNLHQKENIKVYNEEKKEVNYTTCGRCSGAGCFPEYSHIQGGVCFECNGERYTTSLV